MDTLSITVAPRRAYALLALTFALLLIAALSDTAGRLLAAPAAVVVLGMAVRDLLGGPVLVADAHGVDLLQGMRRVRAPWSQVERMRVVKDRRTEMLELDLGSTLALLSRHRLGRYPDEVLADLLTLRGAATTRSPDGRAASG